MNKIDIVKKILFKKENFIAIHKNTSAHASANLAICKYWGKKNEILNIANTGSISIPLTGKGATSSISCYNQNEMTDHKVKINDNFISNSDSDVWSKKLLDFINFFLPQNNLFLEVNIKLNIPVAAGLASSSCIYASLIKAFAKLYNWQISSKELSILARLGSGSAARSIYENHFVEYLSGKDPNGMDSYSQILSHNNNLNDLKIAIIMINNNIKHISSSEAMQLSMNSCFYNSWIKQSKKDFLKLKKYINKGSFLGMAQIAENNSIMLHSLMLSNRPSIVYTEAKTLEIIKKIWQIRNNFHAPIFFTQDAGANIKILYQSVNESFIKKYFPNAEKIKIFD
ncbi:MAG: diphosphomevalonate decarboxylase [Rickettsia sp.]|nr:diphosphomevalonate decarboxylase [Rickettsia sp.]